MVLLSRHHNFMSRGYWATAGTVPVIAAIAITRKSDAVFNPFSATAVQHVHVCSIIIPPLFDRLLKCYFFLYRILPVKAMDTAGLLFMFYNVNPGG